MLKRYGESRQPFLVPYFSRIALNVSLFNLMLAVGLLYIAFIIFRYGHVSLISPRPISWRGAEFCQMLIPHLMKWSHGFFLSVYTWWIMWIGCSYVEPVLYLWGEAYLIIMNDFFMCSWIWFASILLRIFALMFMNETDL